MSNTTSSSGSGGAGGEKRPTFKPPWVKEGPTPLPVPSAPWRLKSTPAKRQQESNDVLDVVAVNDGRRQSQGDETVRPQRKNQNPLLANVKLRKTSLTQDATPPPPPPENDNFKRPQLKPVPPKEDAPVKKENKLPETVKLRKSSHLRQQPSIHADDDDDDEIDRAIPAKRHAVVREDSLRRLSAGGVPPPPPPPPPAPSANRHKTKNINTKQKERLDLLKSRPKTRPDWTAMLKEIEGVRSLKHVECNDRSQPLLPSTKVTTEHFLYESEKPNVHNELLKQIEHGIKLRKVKTNDRSKPILEGLRKFRRQLTIEEQLQKSQSLASMAPPVDSVQCNSSSDDECDQMDDIDKVRDDLQSTKQMLAMELRNKEAQIRENKRLQARVQNLEAELERTRAKRDQQPNTTKSGDDDNDNRMIQTLKDEVETARKSAEEVERKYNDLAHELDTNRSTVDELKRQNHKLQEQLQLSKSDIPNGHTTGCHQTGDSESDELITETDEDDDEDNESEDDDNNNREERKAQRELKHLRNKLKSLKHKEDNARKERSALKHILKQHQLAMRDEKKKYKLLQKEVDKMAALMKDPDEETEEEEEEEDEDEIEEEETSEESSNDEGDEDSDEESDSEDDNLTKRTQRHENILAALKKGNYLLKTNAERLQDDLNKQKELTATLQEDLDSVLAELG